LLEQLVSLSQTKSKKPEIAAPQAVCDELALAPQKFKIRVSNLSRSDSISHEPRTVWGFALLALDCDPR